ncbi:MAG: hypothetical protein SGPRY_012819 [Prymnesium sp.]
MEGLAGPQTLRSLALDLSEQLSSPLLTASEAYAEGGGDAILATRVGPLDHALGGGVCSGEVTEIVGPSRAGKSELCLSLLAAGLCAEGGGVFIDTCGCFRAERLYQLMGEMAPCMSKEERKARLGERLRVVKAVGLSALVEATEAIQNELASLPNTPALGQQWLHTADVRLALRPDTDVAHGAVAVNRSYLVSIIKCPVSERKIATADDCVAIRVTSRGVVGEARGAQRSLDFHTCHH